MCHLKRAATGDRSDTNISPELFSCKAAWTSERKIAPDLLLCVQFGPFSRSTVKSVASTKDCEPVLHLHQVTILSSTSATSLCVVLRPMYVFCVIEICEWPSWSAPTRAESP